MAVALCHHLPRDNALRCVFVLLFIAFILILSAIIRSEMGDPIGRIEMKSSANVPQQFRLEVGVTSISTTNVTTDGSSSAENGTTTTSCSNNVNDKISPCKKFLKMSKASGVLQIVACILLLLALVGIIVLTSEAIHSTAIVLSHLGILFLPAVFCTTSTAIAAEHAVPEAKKVCSLVASSSTSLSGSDTYSCTGFKRTAVFNLAIAANFFLLLAFLVVLLRLFHFLGTHRNSKESGDVDLIMQGRIANDDTNRQKNVWKRHVEQVREAFRQNESEEEQQQQETTAATATASATTTTTATTATTGDNKEQKDSSAKKATKEGSRHERSETEPYVE